MIQVFKPKIRDESVQNVVDVLKSGWIGLGPKTHEFEQKFGEYIGVKNVVCVNSCTSALHLAIVLSGISEGDEVITTANTFVSTNHVILYEGGVPIFCDISLDNGCIDESKVEELITNKTKAIVCVHFGGYPCNMDKFVMIAKKYNLILIEDCAHASGSVYNGKKCGSFGDFACFSFHAVKNLPMGDGGALVVKDDELYQKALKLRWLGIDKDTHKRSGETTGGKYLWKYNVDYVGYKYHMNDINAAIGINQLNFLDEDNNRRKEIATMYANGLKNINGISIMGYDCNETNTKSSFHFYPILVNNNREELILKLKHHDVNPGVHYFRNDAYAIYNEYHKELPFTDIWSKNELTLPIHLFLTDDNIQFIINIIKKG